MGNIQSITCKNYSHSLRSFVCLAYLDFKMGWSSKVCLEWSFPSTLCFSTSWWVLCTIFYYSGILISQTLNFLNLPITLTKSRSLPSVDHCNFTPDFSNSNFLEPILVSLGGLKDQDSTVFYKLNFLKLLFTTVTFL